MHTNSIRVALTKAFNITLSTSLSLSSSKSIPTSRIFPSSRTFTSTSNFLAKKSKSDKTDRRITLIRYFLHHPTTLTPRPLRFSRNRSLRHWTIQRAWNLFKSKLRRKRELELQRQYAAMVAANEELRIGLNDGGRLFRISQMKTGIWSIPERGGGVPVEYARGLVEWVGTENKNNNNNSDDGNNKDQQEGDEKSRTQKVKIWDSDWTR